MTHVQSFDVIVIGTGPSGGTIARKVASDNRSVAIVEEREFGGVCALRGCNPKKVYTNAGALVDQAKRSRGKLLGKSDVEIDWRQLHRFKQEFTVPVAESSEKNFQDAGIKTFHGAAAFVANDQIRVGDSTLRANRFVIATGATPAPLQIPGEELVMRSDDFLDMENMPRKIVFLGGGYISMEFAHVIARCGIAVTIIEKGPRILSGFDADLVDQLVDYSQRQGIEFLIDRDVKSIERVGGDSLQVHMSEGCIEASHVIHGAGRVPNIDGLRIEAGEIASSKQGICVNAHLQCPTNERVFACGDCADTGKPRLTPVANEEARVLLKNLFAEDQLETLQIDVVPKVAFTTPSIAAVGCSEEEAAKSHENLDVRVEETSSWGSVRKTGDTVAGYKILIDRSTDRIVGAHLLGPAAEETINLFALAMKHDLTASELKSNLFAFPTFASDVRQML